MSTDQAEISTQGNAWHQQPTVWIVLGVLAFTIVSSVVLLYLAATNPPELIIRTPTPADVSADIRTHD